MTAALSGVEPFFDLFTPDGRRGELYRVLPDLERPRWVVPADSFQGAAALRAFDNGSSPLRSLWTRQVTRRNAGTPVSIAPEAVRDLLPPGFADRPLSIGFHVGPPSAYRMVTGVALEHGVPAFFAKLGFTAPARARLRSEHAALEALSVSPVSASVPVSLGVHPCPRGEVLGLTVLTGRPGPRRLQRCHHRWFQELVAAGGRRMPLEATATWRDLERDRTVLLEGLSGRAARSATHALDRVAYRLGGSAVPASWGHGDFTPWNTRLADDGRLLVFDWEAARSNAVALVDPFQFEISSTVAFRTRRWEPVPRAAARIVRDVAPDLVEKVPWLAALALLDVTREYAVARATGLGPSTPGPMWSWIDHTWSELDVDYAF